MIVKSILLAVILSLGPVLQTQSSAAEVVREGRLRSDHEAGSEPSIAEPAVVVGWNNFHVAFCYVDGNGVFQIQTVEGPLLFAGTVLDVVMLTPGCQTGNLIAIYVTSVSGQSFFWSGIVTYPFK